MQKTLIFLIVFQSYFISAQNSIINFTPSTDVIANPERGLFRFASVSSSSYELLNQTNITNYRLNTNITLIYREFILEDFKTTPISQDFLNNMQTDFNRIRNAGLKCIIRFVYSIHETDLPHDASKEIILSHILQLQPYFNTNSDIISVVQAGFIGTWGEWSLTSQAEFGGNGFNGVPLTTVNYNHRKDILDAILNALPSNRMVQIRTPLFKRKMYGLTPISDSQGYNGTTNARIGHFNDCFLVSDTDDGTYTNTSIEYPYLIQETKFLPMGGETCGVNSPRSDCTTALQEMALFHWSYLNKDYYPEVIDGFVQQNCFNDIQKKLGYRFELTQAILPQSVALGTILPITLKIKNQGFAAPYNDRNAYIILKNLTTNQVYPILMSTNPRKWLGTNEIIITENLTLPTNLTTGNYKMYLSLPDKSISIANRPEYAIRLANSNIWESTTGYNNLNHTINVTDFPLGIINNSKFNIDIYPVPTNNELNIEMETIQDYVISFSNYLGQKIVPQYSLEKNKAIINTLELNDGLYFIEFSKGTIKDIRKIIISHK